MASVEHDGRGTPPTGCWDGKARSGTRKQVSASERGGVADGPGARAIGREAAGPGEDDPQAGAAGCTARRGTPRAVFRAEAARVRGRRATPAFTREKAGTTDERFIFRISRGGSWRVRAVPRPRSPVDLDSRRTFLLPCLQTARSLWPGALPSRRRARSPYRVRPRETTRDTHRAGVFPVHGPIRSLQVTEPGSGGPAVPPR